MWKMLCVEVILLSLAAVFLECTCNQPTACLNPSVTTVSGPIAPQGVICSKQLIFSEEFNTLEPKVWRHDITLSGGGNWEFEWYTNNRSISFAENGIFHIRPQLTADVLGEAALYSSNLDVNGEGPGILCTDDRYWGCLRTGTPTNILNPVRSAKISTAESFSFKYGYMEFSAKVSTGDWLWPALWMLPRYNMYGGWPMSGEIDILESRGNTQYTQDGSDIGPEQMGSTLHWGTDYFHNQFNKTHFVKNRNNFGFNKNFTTYGLLWTPDNITFYVDGEVIGLVQPETNFWALADYNTPLDNPWKYSTSHFAPFDQEFYIIINLAVGGTGGYFPDDGINGPNNNRPKPWINNSTTANLDFWNKKSVWYPTWNIDTDDSADFQVDYIKIWAL